MSAQRRRLAALLAILLSAGASLAAFRPVLGLEGWPRNNDGLAGFMRVEVFRLAFAHGDPLPLWTPFAQDGYGSTFPFLYPRLFNTIAAGLALATGSTASGVRLALVLLLAAGAFGMQRALTAAGMTPLVSAAGTLLFALSNYTFTDWLVRGAFAEFTAFMLVPWIYRASFGVVLGERLSGPALGTLLALLLYAHPAIFYFGLLLVPIAFGSAWRSRPRADRRRIAAALAGCAAPLTVLAGPFALALLLFKGDFELQALEKPHLDILRNFEPLWRYFMDDLWGVEWHGYSVRIGGFLPLALVLGALAAAGLFRGAIPREFAREKAGLWRVVLASEAVFFLLQTPLAAPVYRWLPGAKLLQFPWRLLVFLTPGTIVLLGLSYDAVTRGDPRRLVRGAATVALVAAVAYQVWFAISLRVVDFHGPTAVEAALSPKGLTGDFLFGGEYFPRGVTIASRPRPGPLFRPEGCALISPGSDAAARSALDAGELRVEADAAPGGVLHVGLFTSPFLTVDPGARGTVEVSPQGTYVVRLGGGPAEVRIARRGLFQAVGARLARMLRK